MSNALNILIIEDSADDAELLVDALRSAGYEPTWRRVESEAEYLAGLAAHPQIVFSDFTLPQFSTQRALELLREHRLEIPFILVSGTIGETLTVECLKAGATDYVSKNHYERLGLVVQRALREARTRADHRRTEEILRKSEERFRQLAECIREVFWMTDAAREQMLYISPGYEEIWGRTPESLYRSPQTWLETIHADDRERIRQAAQTKQCLGLYDEEYRIIRPDGSQRWVHDRAFPIRDSAGNVYRLAGIAEDITERRQLEAQFRQAQKMEAIGTLSGGIAHDFNNVLSAILGNAELARLELEATHPAWNCLAEILKACERAKKLVQQILTFSRRHSVAKRPITLGQIVDETVSLLRATIPAGIEIFKSIPADDPFVLAEPTQIHQALMNLCTNAWQALDGHAGRLDIEIKCVAFAGRARMTLGEVRPGRYARLTVKDTGRGMDARTVERIFEPFFTTKDPATGTGLGLSVVHGIVQSHDGAIHVASSPGQGSTFQLYFPVVEEGFVPAPPVERTIQRGQGQSILYLDDEEVLALLGKKMLEELGYVVAAFSQPEEVLRFCRADPFLFNLVITDFNMPGRTGLQVASELRSIRRDLKIILTSGYITDQLREDAARAGISEIIYKPATLEELSFAVQQALTGSEKADLGEVAG